MVEFFKNFLGIDVPAQALVAGLALFISVITALVGFIWTVVVFFARAVFRRARRCWVHNVTCKITLAGISVGQYNTNIKGEILGFYCLIIRYGADDYLKSSIATDDERDIGDLQNRTKRVKVVHDTFKCWAMAKVGKATINPQDNVVLRWTIPVHRRLGTQFKCFFSVHESTDLAQLAARLRSCDALSHSRQQNRMYFVIKRYLTTQTVDNFKNNLILPRGAVMTRKVGPVTP